MIGVGQWTSGLESWGPNWDLPRKKNTEPHGIDTEENCVNSQMFRKII